MLPLLAQYLNDDAVVLKDLREASTVYKNLAIIASRNIDFKIDSKNIIFKKMKYIKK